MARLDSYFDPNERKYLIPPQSVELAIQEEKAKAAKASEAFEPAEDVPKGPEAPQKRPTPTAEADTDSVREPEKEMMDLKITNRGKGFLIEQLQKEREGFSQEREKYIEQLIASNRKVSELEARLSPDTYPPAPRRTAP